MDNIEKQLIELEENLHKWFKEKWVRFGPDGKIRGQCAREKSSEGKPKCRPLKSAQAMGKKGRAKAARRKRREDPNPDRSGKAKNVKTESDQMDELKCWKGYTRVQGVPAGAPGSCKKKTEESITESSNFSIEQLATISDQALDQVYGYGRSTPGNTFGWQANIMSATYAKEVIDMGVTDIEKIANAIHKGWNVTAKKFVENPDQFDDTEKLRQSGKLDSKIQQRKKLMNIDYNQLSDAEKEKDRVVARALLQSLKKELSESITPETIHKLADDLGIEWDNEPSFLELTKELTGKEHLDDLNQAELMKVKNHLEKQNIAETEEFTMDNVNENHMCPICGGELVSELLMNEKKDACYYKVKSRYKVWPSAYASGALVKCRKKGAKNWGNKSEGVEELDEKWSKKYKRSIDCSHPKGFSQKAHCQGRKKNEETLMKEEQLKNIIREMIEEMYNEQNQMQDECWECYEAAMEEGTNEAYEECYRKTNWEMVPEGEEHTCEDDEFYEIYGDINADAKENLAEAEYRGRKVKLGKPMRGDVKKFKVFVRNPKTGKVKKVNFGDPNMRIKKSNPKRRKSFRARHKCATAKDRTSARYWSCRAW